MLRINRVSPFKLPLLGSVRVDYLVGRISGYHWVFGKTPDSLAPGLKP